MGHIEIQVLFDLVSKYSWSGRVKLLISKRTVLYRELENSFPVRVPDCGVKYLVLALEIVDTRALIES